jgi:hypothetical protein
VDEPLRFFECQAGWDEMTTETAQSILSQINQGKWGWIKVKAFRADSSSPAERQLEDLHEHHLEETKFLISTIKELCELVCHEK